MSNFFSSRLKNLTPYVPGEQPSDKKYIKLNTNESPFPPSDEVKKAVNSADAVSLNLYPDPDCMALRRKLADLYCVDTKNIFAANGSDDILNFAFLAYGEGGVVFPEISYGFYKVFADFHGLDYSTIPLEKDFSVNYKSYMNVGKMVVIANPNAPTGIAMDLSEIEEIVKTNRNNVVLIDEAYVDFGAKSCYKLIEEYDNLLVVQTFSKSRSMAGARLGFAIASEGIINDLNTIKFSTNPYNINRMTNAAGIAAIESNDYYMENARQIIRIRGRVTEELKKTGFDVLPSKSNFVFIKKDGIDGEYLYKELKKLGILVRHFDSFEIRDYNRVTIGTDEQMQKFLSAIKTITEKSDGK